MNHNRYRFLQIIVVFSLAFFLLDRICSGKILWYINARFIVLTLIGMFLLFAMAGNALDILRRSRRRRQDVLPEDHTHNHSIWSLTWLVLPLVLGLFIPARPLSSSVAGNRGVLVSASLVEGGAQASDIEETPDERNVLDWMRIFNYESDLSAYLGQKASVIGFVLPDKRLPTGHFLVARFAITCCVADAFAIGMAVAWPEADSLPADQWVIVKGPVQVLEIDGQRIPLIQAESVTSVTPPDQPYLFP
jgi:uncharacterized repeat protein (TIGR03943 family)